jgi:hypothetical protein
MNEIIVSYMQILLEQFKFDVSVLSSHPWMYWCLCIPVLAYYVFCIFKWIFLTMPIWITVGSVLGMIKNNLSVSIKK